MSENETVMGVCAKWRDCIESADPSVWNDERIAGLVKTTKAQQIAYLDRIVAAWKREKSEIEAEALAVGGIVEAARHKPGNAAAMREALVEALNKVNDAYDILSKPCVTLEEVRQACREARGIIIPALSAPPRQCDVGTAEEQEKRYKLKREVYHTLTLTNALAWAQTPYAEEGAGE